MSLTVSSNQTIFYYFYQYWIDVTNPRVKNYRLVSRGPELIATILGIWLLFVTVIGPKMMKNRRPFELRSILLLYNVFMVVSNAYFFVLSIKWLDYGEKIFQFDIPSRDDVSEQTLFEIDQKNHYLYTKFIDLLDTIFFVLRKKNCQISFLHLYHHFMVPVLGWMVGKIVPTAAPLAIFSLLNSFVHVIMYSYYSLAALGPGIQKYLWWKKYITQLQLAQFALFITWGVFSTFLSNGYPSVFYWFVWAQNPIFFWLFWDFYKSSYKNGNVKKLNKNQ